MSRWVKGLIAGVATGLSGALLGLSPLGAELEKDIGLRWLFKIRGPIEAPPNVVVIGINGNTATELGLPVLPRDWPRSIHARLVENLVQRNASVIIFDVSFHTPKEREDDLAFAKAISDAGRVVLVERLAGKRQPVADSEGRHKGLIWFEHVVSPIPVLTAAAKGLGPFPLPKLEIAVHQFWAFKPSVDDAPMMPAVALQIYALEGYTRWLKILVQAGAPGIERLPKHPEELADAADVRTVMRTLRKAFKNDAELGTRVADTINREVPGSLSSEERRMMRALLSLYDGNDHRFLNFYGPPGTITTIPYHAVIRGDDPNVDKSSLDFTDKTVFVGFSDLYDPEQPDRYHTVFTSSHGVDLSGVEIAATAFSNLLSDRTLRPGGPLTAVAMLLIFGVIMGAGLYLLPAIIGVFLALALATVYAVSVQAGFNSANAWLPLVTPLLIQLPIALFTGLLGQYLLERRQKKRVSEAITYYLPENVARDLTENNVNPSAVNKIVYGTCLASDMAGFTSISEKLPPGELASFLNDYFDAVAEPIKRHGVDVIEFRADGIMCAWVSEQENARVRRDAVSAALEAVAACDRFNDRNSPFQIPSRIGLETGWIYVGHSGGGGHFVYSIVGDSANTAARIEGLNKHIGTHLLATASVVEDVEELLLRPMGRFQFVGKSEALAIVEILAKKDSASDTQLILTERFSEALEVSEKGQWGKATSLFEAILTDYPDDGPTRFYLDHCRQNQMHPSPPEDPSVIRMDRK